jgi:hypothetical protein
MAFSPLALVAQPFDLFGRVDALYGVTSGGGSNAGVCAQTAIGGCGTVFKLMRPAPGQAGWTDVAVRGLFTKQRCCAGGRPILETITGFARADFCRNDAIRRVRRIHQLPEQRLRNRLQLCRQ